MQPLSRNITNDGLINSSLLVNLAVLLDREININSRTRITHEKQFVRQKNLTNITSKNQHSTLVKNTLLAVKNTATDVAFLNIVWSNIVHTETANTTTTNNYEHLYGLEKQKTKNNDSQIFSQSLIFALYIYILHNNGIQSDCFSHENAGSGRAFFVSTNLTTPTDGSRLFRFQRT